MSNREPEFYLVDIFIAELFKIINLQNIDINEAVKFAIKDNDYSQKTIDFLNSI